MNNERKTTMINANEHIDDGSDGGRLSTIDDCRRAVAHCNKRATLAVLNSDRDHWFQRAAQNEYRAVVLTRGEG